MVVSLEEYLKFTDKEHERRMMDVRYKESMLKDIPYIDNIPL